MSDLITGGGLIAFLRQTAPYAPADRAGDREFRHYKPVDESMVATLRHLKSIGVDLRKITVIRETQLKQTHAGYVSRELAGDDRYQSEKRILGATAISTVKLQRAVESRGGAKALAAATCRGDIFLGHHGNWNTIEAINPAARG